MLTCHLILVGRAPQFKVIDFGVATFDALLAQAAGGYESEASGLLLLLLGMERVGSVWMDGCGAVLCEPGAGQG